MKIQKKRGIFKDDDVMIHSFFGLYNQYSLFALGCKYLLRKDFSILTYYGIFRLRNVFKISEKEKQKWEDPKEFNKLSYEMKAIAKLCLLPDKVYILVMSRISIYIYIIIRIHFYYY